MEATISQYIELVLQREPEEGEAATWAALVNAGTLTLDDVRQSIIDSQEAQTDVYPIILAYQAIYGRVPDAEGLDYWVNVYRGVQDLDDPATPTQNEAMVAVLRAFVDPAQTPEFVDRYGANPNAAQFVTAAYANVLDRAPDQAGLAYWTNRYNEVRAELQAANPDWSVAELNVEVRAVILEQFVSSAEYAAATEAAIDGYLNAVALGEDGAYTGTLWSFDPDAQDPSEGQTYTLTTEIDNITGTDLDDTFNAPLVGAGDNPVRTLNSFDVLDGGEGFDVLNATLVNTGAAGISPTISNIEVFNLTAVSGAVNRLDMSNVTGAQQIWNVGSTANLGVLNVQEEAVLGLRDVAGNTIYRVSFDTEVETQQVVLQGAGSATNEVELRVDADGGIEGLVLDAQSGVNNLWLSADLQNISNLTITGGAALMLATAGTFANIQNVDAAAYTGDLELDISGQVDGEDLNVELGVGDDELTIAASVLVGDDEAATLDGGEGDDNLVILIPELGSFDISTLNFANVSNFETLTLERTAGFDQPFGGDLTFDLSETDFTTLVFGAGGEWALGGEFTLVGSEDFDTITINRAITDFAGDTGTIVLEGFETLELNANADIEANLVADDLVSGTLNIAADVTVAIGAMEAEDLVDLTVNLGANSVFVGPMAGSAESLETVTVTGAETSSFFFFFGAEEEGLATFNLSEMAGTVAINSNGASDNAISVLVGEGDLFYGLGSEGRETFTFVGEDIGEIRIGDFEAGAFANNDRLDFSQFAAVSSIEDLNIALGGIDLDDDGVDDVTGLVITGSDGQFEGSIFLAGLDNSDLAELSQSIIF